MGDAGPQASTLSVDQSIDVEALGVGHDEHVREVNVLVTGFGPFKTFTTNPSFLIASALPRTLETHSSAVFASKADNHTAPTPRTPLRPPNSRPYRINVHVYPTAIRVAYASTSTLIPRLISWRSTSSLEADHTAHVAQSSTSRPQTTGTYDYVLHIGLAAGRTNYTLETAAYRDDYKKADIDNRDGFISGEFNWKRESLPERLDVGWNKQDVLHRWESLTDQSEESFELAQIKNAGFGVGTQILDGMREHCRRFSMLGKGQRAEVELSEDAGRFLCEFILYTSLSTRWKEARAEDVDDGSAAVAGAQDAAANARATEFTHREHFADGTKEEPASERDGKVAFLHVPSGVDEHHISRGVRVAEAAILALVGSWEDGYRNADIYKEPQSARGTNGM